MSNTNATAQQQTFDNRISHFPLHSKHYGVFCHIQYADNMEMNVVNDILDQAERRCKISGSRFTRKRKLVLSLLLKSDKALSAYELVDIYKSEVGENLPAMSVYRILGFLEKEHLAYRLELANKYIACEHISCNKDHVIPQFLICRQCHKVKKISINRSLVADLKNSITESGYRLASPQLEMSCICEKCVGEV